MHGLKKNRLMVILASIVVGIILIDVALFYKYHHAEAQSVPIPFGGRILSVTACTCSGGYLLTIGPPVPAEVVFQLGISTPYAFYQHLRSGPWALGVYSPGGICLIYSGKTCTSEPAMGTILIIGTSM